MRACVRVRVCVSPHHLTLSIQDDDVLRGELLKLLQRHLSELRVGQIVTAADRRASEGGVTSVRHTARPYSDRIAMAHSCAVSEPLPSWSNVLKHSCSSDIWSFVNCAISLPSLCARDRSLC